MLWNARDPSVWKSFLGAFAKRPSVPLEQIDSDRTDFLEISQMRFLLKSVHRLQFRLNFDKKHFPWRQTYIDVISRYNGDRRYLLPVRFELRPQSSSSASHTIARYCYLRDKCKNRYLAFYERSTKNTFFAVCEKSTRSQPSLGTKRNKAEPGRPKNSWGFKRYYHLNRRTK